uniref:Uncharacterized protein n=1 Tax=Anopheles maculatus TaxID=74869 RepID=A0A182T9S9_9DIPT
MGRRISASVKRDHPDRRDCVAHPDTMVRPDLRVKPDFRDIRACQVTKANVAWSVPRVRKDRSSSSTKTQHLTPRGLTKVRKVNVVSEDGGGKRDHRDR